MIGVFTKILGSTIDSVSAMFNREDEAIVDSKRRPIESLTDNWQALREEFATVTTRIKTDGVSIRVIDTKISMYFDRMAAALRRDREGIAKLQAQLDDEDEESTDLLPPIVTQLPTTPHKTHQTAPHKGARMSLEGECVVFLFEQKVLEIAASMALDDQPVGMLHVVILFLKETVDACQDVLLASESFRRAFRKIAGARLQQRHHAPGVQDASYPTAARPFKHAKTQIAVRGGISSEPVTPVVSEDEGESTEAASRAGAQIKSKVAAASAGEERTGEERGGEEGRGEEKRGQQGRGEEEAGEGEGPKLKRQGSIAAAMLEGAEDSKSNVVTVKPAVAGAIAQTYVSVPSVDRALAQLAHAIWAAIARSPNLLTCFYSTFPYKDRVVQELLIFDVISPWISAHGSKGHKANFADVSRDAMVCAFSLRDPRIVRYVLKKTSLVQQLARRAAEAFNRYLEAAHLQHTKEGRGAPEGPNLQLALAVACSRIAFLNTLISVSARSQVSLKLGATDDTEVDDLPYGLMYELATALCDDCIIPALQHHTTSQKAAAMQCVASLYSQLYAMGGVLSSSLATPFPVLRLIEYAIVGAIPANIPFQQNISLPACFSSTNTMDALISVLATSDKSEDHTLLLQTCLLLFTAILQDPQSVLLRHCILSPLATMPQVTTFSSTSGEGDFQLRKGLVQDCWLALGDAARKGVRKGVDAAHKYGGSPGMTASSTTTDPDKVPFADWESAAKVDAEGYREHANLGLVRGQAATAVATTAGLRSSAADILISSYGWVGINALVHAPTSPSYVTDALRRYLNVADVLETRSSSVSPSGPACPALLNAILERLYDIFDLHNDLDTFLLATGIINKLACMPHPILSAYLFTIHDEGVRPWTSLVDIILDLWYEFHKRIVGIAKTATVACEALEHLKSRLGLCRVIDRQKLSATTSSAEMDYLLAGDNKVLLERYLIFQEAVREIFGCIVVQQGLQE